MPVAHRAFLFSPHPHLPLERTTRWSARLASDSEIRRRRGNNREWETLPTSPTNAASQPRLLVNNAVADYIRSVHSGRYSRVHHPLFRIQQVHILLSYEASGRPRAPRHLSAMMFGSSASDIRWRRSWRQRRVTIWGQVPQYPIQAWDIYTLC